MIKAYELQCIKFIDYYNFKSLFFVWFFFLLAGYYGVKTKRIN